MTSLPHTIHQTQFRLGLGREKKNKYNWKKIKYIHLIAGKERTVESIKQMEEITKKNFK